MYKKYNQQPSHIFLRSCHAVIRSQHDTLVRSLTQRPRTHACVWSSFSNCCSVCIVEKPCTQSLYLLKYSFTSNIIRQFVF